MRLCHLWCLKSEGGSRCLQPVECPSRGLLRDCINFANLRFHLYSGYKMGRGSLEVSDSRSRPVSFPSNNIGWLEIQNKNWIQYSDPIRAMDPRQQSPPQPVCRISPNLLVKVSTKFRDIFHNMRVMSFHTKEYIDY